MTENLGTVLFVDDETAILRALQRSLAIARFKVLTSESGADALRMLQIVPVDIIVADVRMPGMDGIELLTKVRDHHPLTCRIILSGQVDRETVLSALASGVARSFFTKPWDDYALRDRLEHLLSMHRDIESQGFPQEMCSVETLPAIPSIYHELTHAVQECKPLRAIAGIIEKDVGLAAKILQTINSALYGYSRVASVERAISMLGMDTVQSISVLTSFLGAQEWTPVQKKYLDDMVAHAVLVQRGVATLLRGRPQDLVENAGSAGLFHDAGQILTLRYIPRRFAAIAERMTTDPSLSFLDAEIQLGFESSTHAKIGAFLLDSWNLPEPVVQAALYHHDPRRSTGISSAIVHAVSWVNRAVAAARSEVPGRTPPPSSEIGAAEKDYEEAMAIIRAARG